MPTELEDKVGELLQQLQEECCKDGAWVENKGVLLTYHFRNVPLDKREPIVSRARELITAAGFNIGNAHCALEVIITHHNVMRSFMGEKQKLPNLAKEGGGLPPLW